MFTCYQCGKIIEGPVKHTEPHPMAIGTGYDFATGKVCNLDFPKAYHPACYAVSEYAAEIELNQLRSNAVEYRRLERQRRAA